MLPWLLGHAPFFCSCSSEWGNAHYSLTPQPKIRTSRNTSHNFSYPVFEKLIFPSYQGESLEKTGSPSISRHLLFLYFIIDYNILQITHVFSLKNPAPRYIPTNVIIYLSILAIIWLKYHLEEIKWNKTCNYFRVLILFILCFCTYANINEFYIHVQVHSCHVWGSEGRHIWRSEDNIHEESFFLSTLWISGIELKWLGLAGSEPFTKPKTCKFLTLCVI